MSASLVSCDHKVDGKSSLRISFTLLFLCFKSAFEKKKNFILFFLLQINIFLVFLDNFDALI
jgi:hypothetical protein